MDREAEPFALASVPEAVAALRAPRPADAARLMEDWLSALTARTRATYRRSLGNVARLVGLSDQAALAACILGAADPVTVRAMGLRFRDLRAREVGAATVNNEMAALGSLYSFLTGRPLVGLKRLRVAADQQARREGPAAIAAVVRAAAAQPGLKGARDAAILAMLADGGLRRAELLSLDVGHVEAEGPEAPRVMSTLKGHGAARVGRPLSSAALRGAAARSAEAGGTGRRARQPRPATAPTPRWRPWKRPPWRGSPRRTAAGRAGAAASPARRPARPSAPSCGGPRRSGARRCASRSGPGS